MWIKKTITTPIRSNAGELWHFRLWWSVDNAQNTQRVFFWNESRNITGIAEFSGEKALHFYKLKQRMQKIAYDPEYRQRFKCELAFPVERYY